MNDERKAFEEWFATEEAQRAASRHGWRGIALAAWQARAALSAPPREPVARRPIMCPRHPTFYTPCTVCGVQSLRASRAPRAPSAPAPVEVSWNRLRAFADDHVHGTCRILSKGDDCECLLCDLDRVRDAYRRAAPATGVVEALHDAWDRMDRARAILTDSNPRPECNWAMLDTSAARAALATPTRIVTAAPGDGRGAQDAYGEWKDRP
jgi:hypothetical protein